MTDMMHVFEMLQPASLDETVNLMAKYKDKAWVIAGGKDSLDWFKDRVKRPEYLIDISNVKELSGIQDNGDHVSIGPMVTLTELNQNKIIRELFPVLADAAGRVASPQIRNSGTIGGNVAQDTRCVYYRDGFPCYRAGGNTCYANTPTAMNREHTLFEAKRCVAVTASDTAPALSVLDAQMVISRDGELRTVSVGDFFVGPEIDIERMTAIEKDKGDLLVQIRIPKTWAGSKQYFEKVADRQVWDFALVNVAMAAKLGANGAIEALQISCGAVQCTPRRLQDVESLVVGEMPNQELETLVERVASRGAKPLNYNQFKAPLMSQLAKRAIRSLSVA
ncbi:FAD binding domain-containing protein [Litorivicinus sp.]|jgi:xanthine dehydrogenase YagS FAD-binding subunit|nr:FAD binding domain-containing protein [Litorivicinus sp.]MDC1208143.1 FAD binding domain-containing protein [Litorivicinus sp.]MDC1466437.1 FAD binding domain-containing protein [Litorivicinus sp.]|tara:strand:- start:6708 stop:7712 length:1005 start_codon:yes stop_codon:yes gene_type:complete